jgi:hypothetical protein
MGEVRLSDVLKINSGIVALLVCLMAVGAYWFVEKVEAKFGNKESLPGGSRTAKGTAAAILIILGLILAIVNPDQIAANREASAIKQKDAEITTRESQKVEKPSSSTFKIVDDEGC